MPAPAEFLQGAREICDKHGILLIIDEVQCGFGRTGKNYYTAYSGVRPDILLTAKVRRLRPLKVIRRALPRTRMPGTRFCASSRYESSIWQMKVIQ